MPVSLYYSSSCLPMYYYSLQKKQEMHYLYHRFGLLSSLFSIRNINTTHMRMSQKCVKQKNKAQKSQERQCSWLSFYGSLSNSVDI